MPDISSLTTEQLKQLANSKSDAEFELLYANFINRNKPRFAVPTPIGPVIMKQETAKKIGEIGLPVALAGAGTLAAGPIAGAVGLGALGSATVGAGLSLAGQTAGEVIVQKIKGDIDPDELKKNAITNSAFELMTSVLPFATAKTVGVLTRFGATQFGKQLPQVVEYAIKNYKQTLKSIGESSNELLEKFIISGRNKLGQILDDAEKSFGETLTLLKETNRPVIIQKQEELVGKLHDISPSLGKKFDNMLLKHARKGRVFQEERTISTKELINLRQEVKNSFSELNKLNPSHITFSEKEGLIKSVMQDLTDILTQANPELGTASIAYKKSINRVGNIEEITGIKARGLLPIEGNRVLDAKITEGVRARIGASLGRTDMFRNVLLDDPEIAKDIGDMALRVSFGKEAKDVALRTANIAATIESTRNPNILGVMTPLAFPKVVGYSSAFSGILEKAIQPATKTMQGVISPTLSEYLIQGQKQPIQD